MVTRYSSSHVDENRVPFQPVSASDERSALDPASQRQHLSGHIPRSWRDVPPTERTSAFSALLRESQDMSPQDVHDSATQLVLHPADVTRAFHKFPFSPTPRQLETARWLIRNATDYRPILVGLAMLRDHAEPSDLPLLTTIGQLSYLDILAARTMATIPGSAPDLIRLADRSSDSVRRFAAEQLLDDPDPEVRDWVRSTPPRILSSELARTIAEHHDLAALLGVETVDDRLWDQAGHLLLAMTSTNNYRTEIGRYADAATVYHRWIHLAKARTLTPDRVAMLIDVANDLATGPPAPFIPNRVTLINNVKEAIDDPDRLGDVDIPPTRFAIRIVTPFGESDVEARVVVDGMPVVAAWFDKGPAETPEKLLGDGLLRATTDPKDVRLATAYCAEACCGGLYVTILREGEEVVWRDVRSSTHDDLPAEIRFDAAEYDHEVARAEQDHGWEWPARTLARLLTEQLRADPAILGQWNCEFEWCRASPQGGDTAQLAFVQWLPDGEFTQFALDINAQDGLAGEIITALRETDPKTTAKKIGGSG